MTMVQSMEPLIEDRSPTAPAPPIRLIVVGVDGSEGAAQAIEWSADLATALDASLLAVHVLTPNHELMGDFSFDTMRTWRRELEARLRGPWVEPLQRAHLRHRCLLVEQDSAASGLIQVAARSSADLIVVGTRGRNGLALASTSHKVAHRAGRPVVVVPPNWKPAPPP